MFHVEQHRIKDGAADWLLRLLGVHGVAVGCKFVAGKPTDVPALVVFAHRKRRRADLLPHEQIPAFVDGLPTDVVAMPEPVSLSLPLPHEGRRATEFSKEVNKDVLFDFDTGSILGRTP
jgi:hypothetical protein